MWQFPPIGGVFSVGVLAIRSLLSGVFSRSPDVLNDSHVVFCCWIFHGWESKIFTRKEIDYSSIHGKHIGCTYARIHP